MASIYARKGILQIKYKSAEGGWKQKSTGLRDTPQNRERIKREFLPALEKHLRQKAEAQNREPIERYAKLYLLSKEHLATYWEIHGRVGKILEFFKNRDIREIKPSEIRAWIASFQCKPKTVSMYMTDLRGIFAMAIQEEVMEKNPFVHIAKPRRKKTDEDEGPIEPFSPEEVARLLDNAPDPLRNFLAISFYTGMRSGEVLGLQLADIKQDYIDLKRSISKGVVSTPKTVGSIRTVPIFEVLRPYLEDQIAKARRCRSIWLFCYEDGRHYYGVDNIRGSKKRNGPWAKLLKEQGIKYRKIYNTRHTFITAMLKSGEMSVLEIAQMAGHTNTKMILERYAKYIKGEHLKISRAFDPFKNSVTTRGDSRGDTRYSV